MKSGVKKIVMTALFAALACAATMAIRIPTPGTGGYIHPGDAIVILSGIILGPACGFLAGGVGSALADLLGGYFFYVPITLVIKGLIALLSAVLYRKVNARGNTAVWESSWAESRISCWLPADISSVSPFSTGQRAPWPVSPPT